MKDNSKKEQLKEALDLLFDGAELIDGELFYYIFDEKTFQIYCNYPEGKEVACLTDISVPVQIKPDCEYAIEEIRKLGGDKAVKLYTYWLDGGKLEHQISEGAQWWNLHYSPDDALNKFKEMFEVSFKYRAKKMQEWAVLDISHETRLHRTFLGDIGKTPISLGEHYVYVKTKIVEFEE